MKVKEEILAKNDVKDKQGWIIPKGTVIYVIDTLKNPMTKKEELIILIDNGTGDYKLMPKTIVEKDLVANVK